MNMSTLAGKKNINGVSSKGVLQGLRPSPLKVRRGPSKIKKPLQTRVSPVIIHLKSPEVIHTKPQDFKSLVQQLTGKASVVDSSSSSASVSVLSHGCSGFSIIERTDEYRCDEAMSKMDSVREQVNNYTHHEVDMVIFAPPAEVPSSSALLSNFTPISPSFFVPSPSLWHEFGPIF